MYLIVIKLVSFLTQVNFYKCYKIVFYKCCCYQNTCKTLVHRYTSLFTHANYLRSKLKYQNLELCLGSVPPIYRFIIDNFFLGMVL